MPLAARRLGSTGLDVPVIGQGTYGMERDPKRSAQALAAGIALGMTLIDTAEIYGDGEAERLVGRAISGCRDRVLLTSKVHPSRASRRRMRRACEDSLSRLRTDRLDLYLLHWRAKHPVAETVEAFENLVATGKIRYWGVSNLDEVALAEFVAAAGPGRVCCNQVLHHLGERSIEHALVPWCNEHDIAVVGYSPFGAGDFPDGDSRTGRVLAEVAAGAGATPRQVALAFLLQRSQGFVIPKASAPAHVEENAAAGALQLDEEALQKLEDAFPVRGAAR